MNRHGVTNHRAKQQPRSLHVESLERRDLLSVDVIPGAVTAFGETQLQILGSDGADEVQILYSPFDHSVLVVENGRTHVVVERFDHIYFEGRGGDDTFVNNTSIPTIAIGGAGRDTLYGGLFVNVLVGGDGGDQIYGRGMYNEIWGDAGCDDHISPGYFPPGYVWGIRPGDDMIECGQVFNFVAAGPGDDTILGHEGIDTLLGEAGDDWIDGAGGDDGLSGGDGNDVLRGGAGNDYLFGDAGNDILLGGAGNDMMWGGTGRDLVIGGLGKDSLFGTPPAASDCLLDPRVGAGGDILIGGTTDFDENDRALLAILDEWTEPTSKRTRIANLQSGVGPFRAYALNARTVHDDGAFDRCELLSEHDWLLEGVVPGLVPLK